MRRKFCAARITGNAQISLAIYVYDSSALQLALYRTIVTHVHREIAVRLRELELGKLRDSWKLVRLR